MSFTPTSDTESLSQLEGSLSLQQSLSRDFTRFLRQVKSWGIGAMWQLSESPSCESLVVYRSSAENCSQNGSAEILTASLAPQFCNQLQPTLLSQAETPTPLSLVLPDCIRARGERGALNASGSSQPHQTYVAGFSLGPADAQWLILWHPQALSQWEYQFLLQQFSAFKYHLAYRKEQSSQARQIKNLKRALDQTGHQLKTQLELIQLHTDLLNQRLQLQTSLPQPCPELQLSIDQIQATISAMHQALKRLTNYRHPQKIVDSHELSQLFQLAIQELRPIWQQKQLLIHCQDSSCIIEADAWQIIQAFQNILHNAIAFSPHRGQISCTWQRFQSEVLIQISDQGPGVKEKNINQIFSPLYSRRAGGTGLGLDIARRTILDHHGQIWAENLAAGGAQISIVLPIALVN